MFVVADTSPINYLVLIGDVNVLPSLYGRVLVPDAVRRELLSHRAPQIVREYMMRPPSWLEVCSKTPALDAFDLELDLGEREAIALAESTGADGVLLDDLLARQVALKRGLAVIGTLGVLRDAARFGFIDIRQALLKLQKTSFRVSANLIDDVLQEFG